MPRATLEKGSQNRRLVYGRLAEPLAAAVSPHYPTRATLDVYEVDETAGRIAVEFASGLGTAAMFPGDCVAYLERLGGAEIIESDNGDNDGWHDFGTPTYQPAFGKTSVLLSPAWVGSTASGKFVVPKWQATGETVRVTNRFREHAVGSGICVAGQDGFDEWCWLYLGCR